MGFLGSLFGGLKRFIGKIGGGMGTGLNVIGKVQDKYRDLKNTLTNLPLVGDAAANLIKKGEDYVQQKTGISGAMLEKGINIARNVQQALPT
jgi:hypothetical protein